MNGFSMFFAGETLQNERINGGAFVGTDGLQFPHKLIPVSKNISAISFFFFFGAVNFFMYLLVSRIAQKLIGLQSLLIWKVSLVHALKHSCAGFLNILVAFYSSQLSESVGLLQNFRCMYGQLNFIAKYFVGVPKE